MGENVIHHFCHEHPLILIENVGNQETLYCYGCRKLVISESAYVCVKQYYCSSSIGKRTLHKRCAELPRQILHPSHPQHPLHLYDYRRTGLRCRLCFVNLENELGYRCFSCSFHIHISCQEQDNVDLVEQKIVQHPSHDHRLTLIRKPASFFYCDGCGIEDWDMAYICSTCDFWIHKTCASLPITITKNHQHPLSLAFNFPIEHGKFRYTCDVCRQMFYTAYWVYYCGDCRYFAHVKCATKEIIPAESSNLITEKEDGFDLIQLPMHDISKDLITPFIIRENGFDKIPADIKDMPPSVVMPETTESFSMLFNYHKHPLSLVSKGPVDDELLMMMICDVCITPIYSPPYYNCATCKYFVHSTCCFLPKTSSYPVSQLCVDCLPEHQNHKLVAYTSSELDSEGLLACDLCQFATNGMVYECEDCKLRIDVKCASLPTTIKYASHPQHKLIRRRIPEKDRDKECGCGYLFRHNSVAAYYCTNDDCDYAVDLGCVLMPQNIKHEQDKHPLPLTYDASVDHPTDFYCEFCEKEMLPNGWMYHCREYDRSFHFDCLTESGEYRNIKFGRQFEIDHRLHPHPLTYNHVTLKLRCDNCHRELFWELGFECAPCNYAVCRYCGLRNLEKM